MYPHKLLSRSLQQFLLLISVLLLPQHHLLAQGCCSGGSGSPIAGGTSQGVLADRQAEVSTAFQYINTNKFQTGDKKVMDFLENYNSEYQYTRFAYGATKNLTISLETGYFYNKTQVGLDKSSPNNKVSCSGIGDIIFFPRYTVYTKNTEQTRNELTAGVGIKIPAGKYLDSSVVYTEPTTGKNHYTPMPAAVMPTTGSQDFIFYLFGYRGYPSRKARIFANALYIRKGWNPIGQKFGDYASVGLFAGKTYFNKLGVTLQAKCEWMDRMSYDKTIDMLAKYNLDVASTGGIKVLLAPQLTYNIKTFSVYALTELPLYQYVNGTAIASQYLVIVGLSYRFMMVKMND
jgi:hypothetical protein